MQNIFEDRHDKFSKLDLSWHQELHRLLNIRRAHFRRLIFSRTRLLGALYIDTYTHGADKGIDVIFKQVLYEYDIASFHVRSISRAQNSKTRFVCRDFEFMTCMRSSPFNIIGPEHGRSTSIFEIEEMLSCEGKWKAKQ